MTQRSVLDLSPTTQGPSYPPSEVMDADGNFIVVGRINQAGNNATAENEHNGTAGAGALLPPGSAPWGGAIVAADSPVPPFGQNLPYRIVRPLNIDALSEADQALVLHTVRLPLPCHNYPMVFAPEQLPGAEQVVRPSAPFHRAYIPDLRPEDGRRLTTPVTLGAWLQARGQVDVQVTPNERYARFQFEFSNLIPCSLYTVMALRQRDLDPTGPTRPGPLGIPCAFVTDETGRGNHSALMPNPFPATPQPGANRPGANRIVNVILLWMSTQCCHGGAIGLFGLGGDIHAQLKLQGPSFLDMTTRI